MLEWGGGYDVVDVVELIGYRWFRLYIVRRVRS